VEEGKGVQLQRGRENKGDQKRMDETGSISPGTAIVLTWVETIWDIVSAAERRKKVGADSGHRCKKEGGTPAKQPRAKNEKRKGHRMPCRVREDSD